MATAAATAGGTVAVRADRSIIIGLPGTER